MARHGREGPPRLARRPSTVGELVTRALRGLVLAALAVLLLVGVTTLVGGEAGGTPTAAAVRAWPDDEARAFAVGFARGYATFGPGYGARTSGRSSRTCPTSCAAARLFSCRTVGRRSA